MSQNGNNDRLPIKWRNGQIENAIRENSSLREEEKKLERVYIGPIEKAEELILASIVNTRNGVHHNKIIVGDQFLKLSSNGRIKLDRGSDLIEEVEVYPFSEDEKLDMTLYISVYYPKDEKTHQEWLNSEITTDENWQFFQDMSKVLYYPIKTFKNVKGPVKLFGDTLGDAFPILSYPFTGFSLGVRGYHTTNDTTRRIRLRRSDFSNSETRKKVRDYTNLYTAHPYLYPFKKADLSNAILLI